MDTNEPNQGGRDVNDRGGNPEEPGITAEDFAGLLDMARNLKSYIEAVIELSDCVQKQGLEIIALRDRVARIENLTGQKPAVILP